MIFFPLLASLSIKEIHFPPPPQLKFDISANSAVSNDDFSIISLIPGSNHIIISDNQIEIKLSAERGSITYGCKDFLYLRQLEQGDSEITIETKGNNSPTVPILLIEFNKETTVRLSSNFTSPVFYLAGCSRPVTIESTNEKAFVGLSTYLSHDSTVILNNVDLYVDYPNYYVGSLQLISSSIVTPNNESLTIGTLCCDITTLTKIPSSVTPLLIDIEDVSSLDIPITIDLKPNSTASLVLTAQMQNVTFGSSEVTIDGKQSITFTGRYPSNVVYFMQNSLSSSVINLGLLNESHRYPQVVCEFTKSSTVNFLDTGDWSYAYNESPIFIAKTTSELQINGVITNTSTGVYVNEGGSVSLTSNVTTIGLSILVINSSQQNTINCNALYLHELVLSETSDLTSVNDCNVYVDKTFSTSISTIERLRSKGFNFNVKANEIILYGSPRNYNHEFSYGLYNESILELNELPENSILSFTKSELLYTMKDITNEVKINNFNDFSNIFLNGNKVTLRKLELENYILTFNNELEIECNITLNKLSKIHSNELGNILFGNNIEINLEYTTDIVPIIEIDNNITNVNNPSMIKLIHNGEKEEFKENITKNVFCARNLSCETYEPLFDIGDSPFNDDQNVVFVGHCIKSELLTCLGFDAYYYDPYISSTTSSSEEETAISIITEETMTYTEETTSYTEEKTSASSVITTGITPFTTSDESENSGTNWSKIAVYICVGLIVVLVVSGVILGVYLYCKKKTNNDDSVNEDMKETMLDDNVF
ncbi:hypothetical protein GPJ56_009983 [Histomonas meleagridis]|uniref:uncharacterized protein n=1 Tax=Histomonas meleagridis TaxID=135588 RepID=UPI00355A3BD1|nr:hypothetical protein GPJ56_009983 [Histomonas meleagridis]KAH0803064.1 hypothetical protein GO595_004157 [Histomonas meleagridis]